MAGQNGNACSEPLLKPSIRTLSLTDLDRIAAIHRIAFPGSLLARLGQRPVERYYHWQMTSQRKIIAIGIEQDNRLVGFCFAGIFRRALSGFVRRNATMLATHLLAHPWVFGNPVYRKRIMVGLRVFFSRRNGKRPFNSIPERFGILSIAVDPQYRRLGYGHRLAQACADFATAMEFPSMFLTVNPKNKSAVLFYEKLGWCKTAEEGVMRKDISCCAAQEIADPAGSSAAG